LSATGSREKAPGPWSNRGVSYDRRPARGTLGDCGSNGLTQSERGRDPARSAYTRGPDDVSKRGEGGRAVGGVYLPQRKVDDEAWQRTEAGEQHKLPAPLGGPQLEDLVAAVLEEAAAHHGLQGGPAHKRPRLNWPQQRKGEGGALARIAWEGRRRRYSGGS
jgi:hypothetical protein